MICGLSRNPCACMRIQTHETQGFIGVKEIHPGIQAELGA